MHIYFVKVAKSKIGAYFTPLYFKEAQQEEQRVTLNLFYKQQRFWATSLKLEWLLILVAYFGFDSENITSVVAYFPFKNIQHCL